MNPLSHYPANPAPGDPAPELPSAVRRSRQILLFSFLALVGLLSGWVLRLILDPKIPKVDLSNATPSVERTVNRSIVELRRHPRSADAWGDLGSVLFAYRLDEAALRCLIEAENRDPRNPRWPYLQGLILQKGRPARALDRFRRTVEICGNEPPAARLRLAQSQIEQRDQEGAARELAALLLAEPDQPHAWLLQAHLALQRGDVVGAITLANRVAGTPATARPGWALLAQLQLRAGNPRAADDAAQMSGVVSGSDEFPDPFQSEALARRVDSHALAARVAPLLNRGRLEEATVVVRQMQKEFPDFPETWFAAGRLESLRKNPSNAEELLQRYLRVRPQSAQGWFQLGQVLLSQQRDGEAAKAFSSAVDLQPDNGLGWYYRGLATGRLGRRAEATQALRQAIRMSPDHLESYLLLADLLLQQGDRTNALAVLDEATPLGPTDRRLTALRQRAKGHEGGSPSL